MTSRQALLSNGGADVTTISRLYPPAYDYAYVALALGAVALALVAMARLWRRPTRGLPGLILFFFILLVPWVGPVTYLLATWALDRQKGSRARGPLAAGATHHHPLA